MNQEKNTKRDEDAVLSIKSFNDSEEELGWGDLSFDVSSVQEDGSIVQNPGRNEPIVEDTKPEITSTSFWKETEPVIEAPPASETPKQSIKAEPVKQKPDFFEKSKVVKEETVLSSEDFAQPAKKSLSSRSRRTPLRQKAIKEKKLSFIPSTSKQYIALACSVLLGISGMGASAFLLGQAKDKKFEYHDVLAGVAIENQKLISSIDGVSATLGAKQEALRASQQSQKLLGYLSAGSKHVESSHYQAKISQISSNIKVVEEKLNALKAQKVSQVTEKAEELSQESEKIIQVFEQLEVIYHQMSESPNGALFIRALRGELSEFRSLVNALLAKDVVQSEDVNLIAEKRQSISESFEGLDKGDVLSGVEKISPIARGLFISAKDNWDHAFKNAETLLKDYEGVDLVKKVVAESRELLINNDTLIRETIKLHESSDVNGGDIYRYAFLLSSLLAAASIVLLLYAYAQAQEKKTISAYKEVENNKRSILRLLGEMAPLRDGDLTQKATIDESITANIADSVNQTIESLTAVVRRIKDTSFAIDHKTQEVSGISQKMLSNADVQSKVIQDATSSVKEISGMVSKMSDKAQKSLVAARDSAQASVVGGEQVQKSIESMQSISQNVEDTSLLMKKVSASSSQISEVIKLLTAITEETNVLALNAAVQAAKAGEAGKGFKVVADSIKELAANAAEATRKVGALIAAAQSDIQLVSVAIEKTSHEARSGVDESLEAGRLLEKLKQTSSEMEGVMREISSDMEENAKNTKKISDMMSVILEITQEGQKSTSESGLSIDEISKMSNRLNESVRSFVVN